MTAEQLAHFQRLLNEQLVQLEESTHLHDDELGEIHTSNDIAGADRAAELEFLEVDATIAASEHRLAVKIRHALGRIDSGTYGLCEACGDSIPVTRLEAKPSVSLCLDCQEVHEMAE